MPPEIVLPASIAVLGPYPGDKKRIIIIIVLK